MGGFRGTADAPLVIYAQGKAANVAPGDEDSIVVENSFYVTLDGLNASGAGRAGATVLCSNHVTIRNGRYTSNRRWGIFSGFADDITIDHNETAGSGREHGIYVSNSADRPIIRGNLAHDNANGGIQINADGSTLPDAKCAWLRAGGTVDGVCTGAVIEDNVIYGNGVRGGAAINLDGVQASIVRNNLLFENHASGIANFKENGTEGPKGMEILGNTVVQAKGARNALLFLAVAGPNRARDNILYHPDANKAGLEVGSAAEASILDSDYNVIDRFNFGETIVSLHDFQFDLQEGGALDLRGYAGAALPRSCREGLRARTRVAGDRQGSLRSARADGLAGQISAGRRRGHRCAPASIARPGE